MYQPRQRFSSKAGSLRSSGNNEGGKADRSGCRYIIERRGTVRFDHRHISDNGRHALSHAMSQDDDRQGAFTIEPETLAIQALAASFVTWQWRVTAKRAGIHILVLKIMPALSEGGAITTTGGRSYSNTIRCRYRILEPGTLPSSYKPIRLDLSRYTWCHNRGACRRRCCRSIWRVGARVTLPPSNPPIQVTFAPTRQKWLAQRLAPL